MCVVPDSFYGVPLKLPARSNWFSVEFRHFSSYPVSMRAVLAADSIYALILPVIEIFVAVYVWRSFQSSIHVFLYQSMVYIATPLAFWGNGYLLQKLQANVLYAASMLASGAALILLMAMGVKSWWGIVDAGLVMGVANGLFWANRGYIALSVTTDKNRNYFFGFETCATTLASIIVPYAIGLFLDYSHRPYSSIAPNHAYSLVAYVSLLISCVAALCLFFCAIGRQPATRFFYTRFHRVWYWMLAMAALRGVTQGYILTAPALLVLRLAGDEGILGKIGSIGGCVGAACFYLIGRISKPTHRSRLFGAGVLLFLLGACVNAMFFNALGAIFFIACLLFAKPLIDTSYNPILLRTIEDVSRIEKRSTYTYFLSHEFGLLLGRIGGCGMFLTAAYWLSEVIALRYVLVLVALIQIPAIALAVHLVTLSRSGERLRV